MGREVFSSNCPSRVVDEYFILFSEQKELLMNSLPQKFKRFSVSKFSPEWLILKMYRNKSLSNHYRAEK